MLSKLKWRQHPRGSPGVEYAAHEGYMYIRTPLSALVPSVVDYADVFPRFTVREKQIIDGILEAKSNKEIGSENNISERTVKFHVSSVLAKMKVHSRVDIFRKFTIEKEKGESNAKVNGANGSAVSVVMH